MTPDRTKISCSGYQACRKLGFVGRVIDDDPLGRKGFAAVPFLVRGVRQCRTRRSAPTPVCAFCRSIHSNGRSIHRGASGDREEHCARVPRRRARGRYQAPCLAASATRSWITSNVARGGVDALFSKFRTVTTLTRAAQATASRSQFDGPRATRHWDDVMVDRLVCNVEKRKLWLKNDW